jgi:hypothetical protein
MPVTGSPLQNVTLSRSHKATISAISVLCEQPFFNESPLVVESALKTFDRAYVFTGLVHKADGMGSQLANRGLTGFL